MVISGRPASGSMIRKSCGGRNTRPNWRKRGTKCGKPSKKNRRGKRCTYYTRAGSFKHVDAAGAVRFRFTGRVSGHALKVGRYRLKAVPRNAAGRGRAAYVKFRIKG